MKKVILLGIRNSDAASILFYDKQIFLGNCNLLEDKLYKLNINDEDH